MKLIGVLTAFMLISSPIIPVMGQSSNIWSQTTENLADPKAEKNDAETNDVGREHEGDVSNSARNNTCIVNFSDRQLNHEDLGELILAMDRAMNHGCNEILLVIDSFGGKYSVGIATYNYLTHLPVTLRTHNIGATSSAAIMLYCAGDIRTASPNSYFLLHNGQLSPGSGLTLEEVGANYGIFQLQIGVMHDIIADCTDRTAQEVEGILNGTEVLLDASGAASFGLVDEIRDLTHELANYDRIEFVGSSD